MSGGGSHSLAYFNEDIPSEYAHSLTFFCVQPPVEVDIKPGSEENPINQRAQGVIPVAVLTTSIAEGENVDFNAEQIDPSTVRFGPSEAEIADKNSDHLQDIDDDGDFDWVGHFPTEETGIACGDTEATITGETYEGDVFEGADSITVRPCARGAGATKNGAISTDNL